MNAQPVRCEQLRHVYQMDGEQLIALDTIDLTLTPGSSNAIIGPSGSGKSTLVTLLAGLQRPTSGRVYLGEEEISRLPETALLRIRAEQVGVAMQNPSRNLLPYADAADNIRFAQRGPRSYRRQTQLPDPEQLLDELGLAQLAGIPIDRLSGGERQRIALAVATANRPGVLIADEPTSQLDAANRDRVVELLRHISTQLAATVIAVTHDPLVAVGLDRTIQLHEGRITEDTAA
jgi:ABC-type lipoprotein export system ATPase subunit